MIDVTTNYIHSRVATDVIDNSIVEEQVVVPIDFVLFQPYTSPEGFDSKVRKWTQETAFVRGNGTPLFNRDGQHIYNCVQWLKGGATVLGLRVVAENSTPAFGVINIRTKPTTVSIPVEGGSPVTVPGLMISPCLSAVPNSILTPTILKLSEPTLLKQILTVMNGQPASVSGWDDHYLTVFKVRGTGVFGNNYGVNIQLDSTREEDLEDGRRYFYNVYKKDTKGNITLQADTYSLSFNPAAVDPTGSVSEFIDTVVTSSGYIKKFDGIAVYTYDDVWDDLVKLFENYCGEVTDGTSAENIISEKQDPIFIDVFSLLDRSVSAYKRFVPPDETELLALEASGYPDTDFSLQSNFFAGGDDGDLDKSRYIVGTAPPDYTGPNKYYSTKSEMNAAYNAVKNELIRKAYAGEIDPAILSEYKYQISAVVDSNNLDDVKKEMIYLCRRRLDIIAYLDCGLMASCDAAINYRKTMLTGFQDWNASVWGQFGTAWDSYNKRNIDVPYTFDLAYKIPFLRVQYGPNKLMAGTKKGKVETMGELAWYPDEDQKTELLQNQINYVEEIRLGQYAIMSNRTLNLKRLSYLAVIRNTHAIGEAIWVGRQILTDLRFEEDPNIAMVAAQEQISRNLQYLKTDGPVERMTVKAEQTQQDKYENAAAIYLEMKFTDFIHTWKFHVVAAR
jgi:hypothetical protein